MDRKSWADSRQVAAIRTTRHSWVGLLCHHSRWCRDTQGNQGLSIPSRPEQRTEPSRGKAEDRAFDKGGPRNMPDEPGSWRGHFSASRYHTEGPASDVTGSAREALGTGAANPSSPKRRCRVARKTSARCKALGVDGESKAGDQQRKCGQALHGSSLRLLLHQSCCLAQKLSFFMCANPTSRALWDCFRVARYPGAIRTRQSTDGLPVTRTGGVLCRRMGIKSEP